MSNRGTQFEGWARQVWYKMSEEECLVDPMSNDRQVQDIVTLLAQAGYDLVAHALNNEKLQWYPMEEISIEEIPDPTEIPNLEKAGIGTLYYGYEEMSRGLPPMPGPSGQAE